MRFLLFHLFLVSCLLFSLVLPVSFLFLLFLVSCFPFRFETMYHARGKRGR